MKRYETRVLVEQSEADTKYYAQYKCRFLWCIPVWECFDPVWAPRNIARASCRVFTSPEAKELTPQQLAERLCEVYHAICDEQEEEERKRELHKKTKKVFSYKHP